MDADLTRATEALENTTFKNSLYLETIELQDEKIKGLEFIQSNQTTILADKDESIAERDKALKRSDRKVKLLKFALIGEAAAAGFIMVYIIINPTL